MNIRSASGRDFYFFLWEWMGRHLLPLYANMCTFLQRAPEMVKTHSSAIWPMLPETKQSHADIRSTLSYVTSSI